MSKTPEELRDDYAPKWAAYVVACEAYEAADDADADDADKVKAWAAVEKAWEKVDVALKAYEAALEGSAS